MKVTELNICILMLLTLGIPDSAIERGKAGPNAMMMQGFPII